MSNLEKARQGWGVPLPKWVERLAEAADARGVRGIAAELGISPALVSLGINHNHHARGYDAIEKRVKAVLMVEWVTCPVYGRITGEQCREEQKKPFVSVNPLSVALWRACRGGCKNFEGKEKGEKGC